MNRKEPHVFSDVEEFPPSLGDIIITRKKSTDQDLCWIIEIVGISEYVVTGDGRRWLVTVDGKDRYGPFRSKMHAFIFVGQDSIHRSQEAQMAEEEARKIFEAAHFETRVREIIEERLQEDVERWCKHV